MFHGASNNHFNEGTFIVNHHYGGGEGGFELLQRAVATGAFHNSGERFDPPRCHPKTRTAVIDKIMNWIFGLGEEDHEAVIMWLNGAVGAGKSAIAQTIAEHCHNLGLLLAAFFFSRPDPSRNNAKLLIPTIAYQIARNLPSTRSRIATAMERDPLLVVQSLETQILALLVEPLRDLVADGYFKLLPCQCLIIIDGLDECSNPSMQCTVLNAISRLFSHHHIPVLFLIVSRVESHLSQAFNMKPLVHRLVQLPLDIDYRSAEDIHLFLNDKFNEIKETHRLKDFIDSSWPPLLIMESLVKKSSGQFIYAATVVRYISSVDHNPEDRLEIILGIRPPQHSNDTPFAELDSLYTHIFSAVENIDKVLQIIGLLLVYTGRNTPEKVTSFLNLKRGELETLLGDLSSIISVTPSQSVEILHVSIGDFLCDPLRSRKFHLNMKVVSSNLAKLCIEHIKSVVNSSSLDPINSCSQLNSPFWDAVVELFNYCARASPSKALRVDILSLLRPEIIRLYQGYPDDLFFEFVQLLLSSLGTPESNPSFHHHVNLFDDFLKPIVRSYYSSPQLTLLLTFLHNWNHGNFYPSGVDNAPYLLSSSKTSDADGLKLASWFYGYYPTRDKIWDDVVVLWDYGNIILDFIENQDRSGELAMNGERFSAAALCCLEYLCDHRLRRFPFVSSSHDGRIRRNTPWRWRLVSIRDANVTKRETRHLHRIWPKLMQWGGPRKVSSWYSLVTSRSVFNPKALEHLPFLLGRSGYSEELARFLRRGARFPVECLQYRRAVNEAKAAIAKYLNLNVSQALHLSQGLA